jgi:simple sugar transport system ATP-binding protein
MTSPVLELKDITKEYHGVPAVKNVSFSLDEQEVHSIVGENGAGKSTLTKIMAGVVEATRGQIFFENSLVTFKSPAEALRRGIAMVFQETSLVPSLTVAQNLYLGEERLFNRLRGLYIAAQQFLQYLNFPVDPTVDVSSLGAAQKQMVEIARAVHHRARVIIFDEPTASLTPEEKGYFFALMDRLKGSGVSLIFISHTIEDVLAVSDRITILRDGEHVLTENKADLTRETIIRSMVGRALSKELYGREADRRIPRSYGLKVLSVQNISMGKMVRNTSFSIYAGQITGVFGLVGSGRTETAKIVCGLLKRDLFYGGEIKKRGKRIRFRVPRQGVKQGIVYVTEDRKLEGFFETMSIADNLQVNVLAGDDADELTIHRGRIRSIAEYWRKRLNIRAITNSARVAELSGGNQQKVVIARSLVQKPDIIFFDEPTRGVDVGAIAEIHQLIGALADEGLAVVVISSYLPEILNISDRILVCRQGRIVEEFDAYGATEEAIMFAAVH